MTNRFQSIVDNITTDRLKELQQLWPKMIKGHWLVAHGRLLVQVDGELYEFEFAEGDPDSEAIVLLLNSLKYIMQSLGEAHETHD